MIDTDKLPEKVKAKVGVPDSVLAAMSPEEAFEMWLHYEGIIGYTQAIIGMLDALRAAEVKH